MPRNKNGIKTRQAGTHFASACPRFWITIAFFSERAISSRVTKRLRYLVAFVPVSAACVYRWKGFEHVRVAKSL
jgi:hypothetical protein